MKTNELDVLQDIKITGEYDKYLLDIKKLCSSGKTSLEIKEMLEIEDDLWELMQEDNRYIMSVSDGREKFAIDLKERIEKKAIDVAMGYYITEETVIDNGINTIVKNHKKYIQPNTQILSKLLDVVNPNVFKSTDRSNATLEGLSMDKIDRIMKIVEE